MTEIQQKVLNRCQSHFPDWRNLDIEDVKFGDPKGFSSYTMSVEPTPTLIPRAVFYRKLENKENAILDFETEKSTYLLLANHNISAPCFHYSRKYRLESFYKGQTLNASDLTKPQVLKKIADQLFLLHQLSPKNLPTDDFFSLVFVKWGKLARQVLENEIDRFPANEKEMCLQLRSIYSPETIKKVRKCIPDRPLSFCHNDTYHGNIMKLQSGEIKLLDFEFSCLNNRAYDFSNLFAETVMKHKQPAYPYFKIVDPEYGVEQISLLINYYLDNFGLMRKSERKSQFEILFEDTKKMLLLSHFKYALAAIPLAVNPIQKIRFIPYAFQRYSKFLQLFEQEIT